MKSLFGRTITAGAACLIALLPGVACHSSARIRPPSQPEAGPGGKNYAHRLVLAQRFDEGNDEYWLFTPDGPQPTEAPVVVFVHGWSATDPFLYGAWIRHLVRRGNIVVYPRYQKNLRTRLDDMTPNALRAVQAAMHRLELDGPVHPVKDQFGFVGHSMGGFIATNLAAMAVQNGLPQPRVLMVVEPGDGENRMPRLGKRLSLADTSQLPNRILFMMVTGDADTVVGERGARKIWKALEGVPSANKNYVTVASDRRPRPKLIADHFSPLAVDRCFPEVPSRSGATGPHLERLKGGDGFFERLLAARRARVRHRAHRRWVRWYPPDTLDYYGYWRLFDGLLDAAFHGMEKSPALVETADQRFMGECSDGSPVHPLIVKSLP